MKNTQEELVLKHLKDFGSITSWEAFMNYGVTRLSAIIFQLRRKFLIDSENLTEKNRYGHAVTFSKYILREN